MRTRNPESYSSVTVLAVTVLMSLTSTVPDADALQLDISSGRVQLCGVIVYVDDVNARCFERPLAARKAALRACRTIEGGFCTIAEVDLAHLAQFRYHREIPGFCRRKEQIFDVRCFDPVTKELRYVIWVNTENGASIVWGQGQMRPSLVAPPEFDEVETCHVQATTLPDAKVKTFTQVVAAIRAVCPYNDPNMHRSHREDYQTHIRCVKSVEQDIPGFAKRGDRVWEAIRWERQWRRMLVWVHAETGKVYFLTEQWHRDGRERVFLPYEQLRAAVAKVRHATDYNANIVRPFAFGIGRDPAIDHVPFGWQVPPHEDWWDVWPHMMATGGVGVYYVTKLGFEIPGFAKQGDRIWECKMGGFDGTKLVIWVNPKTQKNFFVNRMFEYALSTDNEE